MTDAVAPQDRPPYRAALAVTLVVLAGYIASLAPTVTFWDAGEFIAATKILGIPHPPGTPLFVLMGHVWAALLPLGSWAYRTNLMSASFSAAGAGVWFLVVYESLRDTKGAAGATGASQVRMLGAAAAAIIGAFSFTNWQNSNETEVYAVGTFTIAASCWLALRWRAARGTRRAPVYLLLIVYLQGLSVANHLLALLVGPAIIGFIFFTLRATPLPDALERRHEWAKLAAMAGIWALLIGTGLGNVKLLALGALCFVVATLFALTAGAGGFATIALLLAVVGVSPYLFLYIRSGQHPMVNEAAPATWDALLAVIRRAQYPPRGPLDDPTVVHGPDNPGRSLTIIWLQIQNYLLYWLWQFGKSGMVVVQAVVFAGFLGLGVRGSLTQRRNDRGAWWLLLLLWLVTGAGLVAYMNFKPGFSLGYAKDLFPDINNHEVRERDYFFVVSFVVWGLWAGMGLWSLVKRAAERRAGTTAKIPVAAALFLVALVPPVLNWREASRRSGADRTLAADLAYNLLNTVPPYGILFTYGDNDTFPLWWAQEVAGIRQDVTVVCLALAQTDWYMRQLRDNPVRDFDEAAAPKVWQGLHPVKPTWPLHSMTDDEVKSASTSPILIDSTMSLPIGPIVATLKAQTVLYPNDIVSLRIIQQNLGRRAIVWSLTTGDSYEGLRDYVVQQAMGFRLATVRPDSSQPGISLGGIGNVAVDMPLTQTLAWETYQYGSLLSGTTDRLESTAASMASSLSIPFTILAYHADAVGDTAAVVKNLERADQIAPNEAIRSALTAYKSHLLQAAPTP
jgi:hypothetical protein